MTASTTLVTLHGLGDCPNPSLQAEVFDLALVAAYSAEVAQATLEASPRLASGSAALLSACIDDAACEARKALAETGSLRVKAELLRLAIVDLADALEGAVGSPGLSASRRQLTEDSYPSMLAAAQRNDFTAFRTVTRLDHSLARALGRSPRLNWSLNDFAG